MQKPDLLDAARVKGSLIAVGVIQMGSIVTSEIVITAEVGTCTHVQVVMLRGIQHSVDGRFLGQTDGTRLASLLVRVPPPLSQTTGHEDWPWK